MDWKHFLVDYLTNELPDVYTPKELTYQRCRVEPCSVYAAPLNLQLYAVLLRLHELVNRNSNAAIQQNRRGNDQAPMTMVERKE
jgi:hypothetical protein